MALHKGTLDLLDNQIGVSDAVLLEPLTEDNFIENIQKRFSRDQIYTYIGNVVVSMNPYRKLPLYTDDVIFEYKSRNIYELPPHVYAIADMAYRSMRDQNLDQCIIISGESGSGKTEASKVIMQYVAAVSGKGQDIDRVKEQLLQSNPVLEGPVRAIQRVKAQLLQSNPILEAFGNAKTNRNDNSSRFGKYMDIEFDFKGDPVGGVITNYVHEKSRVAVHMKGERSFHIFYQLLSGADSALLKSLRLQRNHDSYNYLKHSGDIEVDTIDDKEDFQVTRRAMQVIGFTDEEIMAVFQLVASVLKLGNVTFDPKSNKNGTEACEITKASSKEVNDICDLLQCDSETLTMALTGKTVETRGDRVAVSHNVAGACYARDALAKAVYTRLFSWLVMRINDSIQVRTPGRRKVMGVLDIYGFEIFQNNSFEQFIINYCNEKLQQIFIELTLKEEQEEYIKEGIEWIHVDYFNNAVICELIEKSNVGILAMLDEECLRPGDVTDQTFLNKLNQTCANHPHYESRGVKKTRSDKTLPHDCFRLQHYAGAVVYKVVGFLDKNNDLLFRDLSQAMFNCSHSLCQKLFPEGDPSKISLKRPPTAGFQFKQSVAELMKNLLCKNPNYIRCIKPNDLKRSRVFETNLVRHQVRYLGLMENVRVRRAGYAFRQPYEQFLYRYKMLADSTWPRWRGLAKLGVKEILEAQEISPEEFTYGKTKIFIRNPQTLFDMEERRRRQMHYLATCIQKIWRGWHQKMIFKRMKAGQLAISRVWRGYRERKRYHRIRRAVITMEAFYRGMMARRRVKKIRFRNRCIWAVGVIKKFYLGWQVRKQFRKMFRSNAAPKIIRFMQTSLKRKFLLNLAKNLPSKSPIDNKWPKCSFLHRETSEEIRKIYHRWRCMLHRRKFDETLQSKMREKVTASNLFKDKKTVYPVSVPHPYKGDYIRLRQNIKWKKVSSTTGDEYVVFADLVNKIHRSNGKMASKLLVVSTNALLVVDQRSLAVKYRLPIQLVEKISLSPYDDTMVIIHVRQENGLKETKKGDFLFSVDHVIEMVAKLYLVIKNAMSKPPEVHVSPTLIADLGGHTTELNFRAGQTEVPDGILRISKKNNKFEILQS